MKKIWHEREQYGNMLKDILEKQIKLYGYAKDPIRKTKIAQNIGYLIQVQSHVIKEEKNVEERIQRIEELLGRAQLNNEFDRRKITAR